jgi:hypothetical protein
VPQVAYGPGGYLTTTLPAGATAPGSAVVIDAYGYFPDASAPAGVSELNNAHIPLSAFATSASVAALASEVQLGFARLSQEITTQARIADAGVAQALALAGSTDLQSDEHFALSMNVGAFNGQTALAASAAARLSHHVSINAGYTRAVDGGPSGGRAGIRIGW